MTISRRYIIIMIISEHNYNVHLVVFEVKIILGLVNWHVSFISKAKPISEIIVIIKLYFAIFVHGKSF